MIGATAGMAILIRIAMKTIGLHNTRAVSEAAKLYLGHKQMMKAHTNPAVASASSKDGLSAGHWYALYTCPRHEKRVAEEIEHRDISCFLPLYRSVRRWKDRRKELELALFPGYVFVHIALQDKLRVLQVPGAVRIVSFNGQPAALPEQEIECLQKPSIQFRSDSTTSLPLCGTPRPRPQRPIARTGRHHPSQQRQVSSHLLARSDNALGGR